MRTAFLLLYLTVAKLSIYAQINAGIYNSQDNYVNVIPDTIVKAATSSGKSTDTAFYYIDINSDAIDDFILKSYINDAYPWNEENYVMLIPLNTNEVAVINYDTCWSNDTVPLFVYDFPLAKSFVWNDTINRNNWWLNSPAYLARLGYSANYPTNVGHVCSHGSFGLSSAYIGTRVFLSGDTLYGWIKMSAVTNKSATVEEYACNKYPTVIEEYAKIPIRVYPNPAKAEINFVFNKPVNSNGFILKIHDSLGQIVVAKTLDCCYKFSVGDLQHGVYHFTIESEQKHISSGKFMVSD